MPTKVKLRQKAISGGRHSLYLDFYPPIPDAKRPGKTTRREFLNLYVFTIDFWLIQDVLSLLSNTLTNLHGFSIMTFINWISWLVKPDLSFSLSLRQIPASCGG